MYDERALRQSTGEKGKPLAAHRFADDLGRALSGVLCDSGDLVREVRRRCARLGVSGALGDRGVLGFATVLLAGLSAVATLFAALVVVFFEDCR
ncbi:MAG: hypothetical protein V4773_16160 [Verrucomicrobiota bacterium]